ncbi:MAG: TetR/AcrR family transcriptional regulator [Bdellovibrionales bacterium]|nr:TetR/AcrR family transcriptional regulator [Bdellovibrionales bacterium]
MPPKTLKNKPRPYHHGDLHAKSIAQGKSLLKKKGLNGWSLRNIAKNLGVSHVALYRHFSSREDLLAEIAAQIFNELTLKFSDPSVSSFSRCGQIYIEFATQHPQLFDLIWTPQLLSFGNENLKIAANQFLEISRLIFSKDEVTKKQNHELTSLLFLKKWTQTHGLAHLASRKILEKMQWNSNLELEQLQEFLS